MNYGIIINFVVIIIIKIKIIIIIKIQSALQSVLIVINLIKYYNDLFV